MIISAGTRTTRVPTIAQGFPQAQQQWPPAGSRLPRATPLPPLCRNTEPPAGNQSGGAQIFHDSSCLPPTPHPRCSGGGGGGSGGRGRGLILRTVSPLPPGQHGHIRKLGRGKEPRAALPPPPPPRGERTGTLPAAAYAPPRGRGRRRGGTYSAATETAAAVVPSRAGAVPRRRGEARAASGGVSVHGTGRQERHPLEVAAALASALLAPAVAAHASVSARVAAGAAGEVTYLDLFTGVGAGLENIQTREWPERHDKKPAPRAACSTTCSVGTVYFVLQSSCGRKPTPDLDLVHSVDTKS